MKGFELPSERAARTGVMPHDDGPPPYADADSSAWSDDGGSNVCPERDWAWNPARYAPRSKERR